MGKPTHIILVRHGESEGNLDHSLFRIIPDHKIKLTPRGIRQAYEAGLRLRRDIIACDERVQFFVSPYERTRQTYVAVKRAITDGCTCQWNEEERGERIVYREEPRLREQDWGNFQHPPELMKEIREERKRFGHFFYRLPNGESGADVYDRLSTFIDTLHRAFEKPDFPSKCVIITHGLLIRLFLTRWFHYPFDEFEALQNLHNGESVIMELDAANPTRASYRLVTPLRKHRNAILRREIENEMLMTMIDNIILQRGDGVVEREDLGKFGCESDGSFCGSGSEAEEEAGARVVGAKLEAFHFGDDEEGESGSQSNDEYDELNKGGECDKGDEGIIE